MVDRKLEQGSDEWFAVRKALVLTASRFGDAMGYGQSSKAWDYYEHVMMAKSKP